MHVMQIEHGLADWRQHARDLLAAGVPPDGVLWGNGQTLLKDDAADAVQQMPRASEHVFRVPSRFMGAAEWVACHRSEERWPLLYRLLWRLTHGEPRLLEIAVDPDVHQLLMMEKAVHRDVHKMKAFVRFRKMRDESGDQFIAWHRPDHLIARLAAPFFQRRFGAMRWTIFTPDQSVAWDMNSLQYGPGMPRSSAPAHDELEEAWRTYYASVFNPARIKLKAMRKEMPLRFWQTLPETQIIDQLLRTAPKRVATMLSHSASCGPSSANAFLPAERTLRNLKEAAAKCKGCPIHCNATQTVFGEGPDQARLMFIGEQPGDQEDLAGHPFVGPAGQLFDRALAEIGIDREAIYVTNAVKHFKWEPRGHRRIHSKPSSREVAACRPWLEAEIATLRPQMIVCLGATAAQSLLGAGFRVTANRGKILTDTGHAPQVMATVHPSSILRTPDPTAREQAYARFVADLTAAVPISRIS